MITLRYANYMNGETYKNYARGLAIMRRTRL